MGRDKRGVTRACRHAQVEVQRRVHDGRWEFQTVYANCGVVLKGWE